MDFKGISDPVVIVSEKSKRPGLFSKIRPPLTNFKINKVLGGALTVLLLFAVGVGVYLAQKPTQLKPQAAQGNAEISIKPETQSVSLNQEFQSDVFLDTKDLEVTAIQVKITFDSNTIQLIEVTPGDFLTTVLTTPQNTANSTFFAIGQNPGKKGSGKLATIRFKATNLTTASPTKIQFDQQLTQGTSLQTDDDNSIGSYLDSNITITSAASPSPLASATASPSPSPSYQPGFCSSSADCPNGYYCPPRGSVPPGIAVDVLCTPIASPSPSPSSKPKGSPNNRVTLGSKGDGNSDGVIEYADLSILFTKWSPAIDITSGFQVDFNDDKRINSFDSLKMNEMLYNLGVVRK